MGSRGNIIGFQVVCFGISIDVTLAFTDLVYFVTSHSQLAAAQDGRIARQVLQCVTILVCVCVCVCD